jgi:hypothetical protein
MFAIPLNGGTPKMEKYFPEGRTKSVAAAE